METHETNDLMCVEVQINATSTPEKQVAKGCWLQSSAQKSVKRKNHDGEASKESVKKSKPEDSRTETSNCESSDDGSNNRTQKGKERPKSKKINVTIDDPVELKNVLDGMDDEINDVLEETAEKNRLTAANVKNILRHVITNEYVLAMVRNTMKADNAEDDLEEAVFEPKLTRSKVKELREKQHRLPWPMSTPVKQPESVTKALLDEEFSDESSSDEDYKPNEEECPSEEDNLDSSICEKPETPAVKEVEENIDADDDIGLVIALPEPEPAPSNDPNTEVDKIALRTRSKLPLTDTPLAVIGASFVAPDISEDMYDTHCYDVEWQNFVQELRVLQELDTIVAVENLNEETDNAEDDPEYNVLEDDDIIDELELRDDNNVKITRKELNALIAETLETLELGLNDGEIDGEYDEDDDETDAFPRIETPVMDVGDEFIENVRTQWMTDEERLILEEQMRMYVQLLTQFNLLSFGYPELNYINESSKLFLEELKMFSLMSATVNPRSAFYAHNLDGALQLVNHYENNKDKIPVRLHSDKGKRPSLPCMHVKKNIYNSPVFMYPDLLPRCGFHRTVENKKAIFTPAEDNLIAIGLEEFSFSCAPVYYINTLLMPCKSEYQIKLRIKNSKGPKISEDNPIKYYYIHDKAPPFPRTVRPFDPNNIKSPKEHPSEILPQWMKRFCAPPVISSTSAIAPNTSNSTKLPIKRRTLNKKSVSRPGYRLLLPRINFNTPLKHISPILKKYNQKRPNTSWVKNSIQNMKQLAAKPRLILPKDSEEVSVGCISKSTLHSEVADDVLRAEINDSDLKVKGKDNRISNNCDSTYSKSSKTKDSSNCSPSLCANDCDVPNELETVDEADEEIMDDEPESTHQDSTMTSNVITKKQSVNKKKNKQQRDLESSLTLLQPNLVESDPKREERETLFAHSYLLRVTEALKDDSETQEKFLKTLSLHQHSAKSPVKIYYEMREILKDYPALADDFIAFLRPEQAKNCGKYKEYITLCKIRAFIRKIEVHFSSQPQHLLKILRTFAQFKQQSSISSVEVLTTLQPLLKNQSHLIEELTNLLPDMAPSESLMTDFQEVTIPNSDDDNSSVDSCEEIVIPETPDPYGGKDCPCDCHTSSTEAKVVNKTRHCVKCGVKFIDGKVYIQTGKVLKPAQVIYKELPPEPSKASTETKASSKSKTNSSPSVKTSVVVEQSSKPEIPQSKKETAKTPSAVQQPAALPEEPVPSSSKLPCDVFEDAVFPALPVSVNKKSVPSDFSQLKNVLSSENTNGKPTNGPAQNGCLAEQASMPQASSVNQKPKWTRDEDKLIIYNCQRFGITEKAFQSSSSILNLRTPEEIHERFLFLMDLLSKEFKI